jgi:hypothetical protein
LLGNGEGILISAITAIKTASGESGQNDVGLVRGKGVGTFAEVGKGRAQQGKRFQPVVLPGLRGKGPVRQRSLFADLIFGYFVSRQTAKPS